VYALDAAGASALAEQHGCAVYETLDALLKAVDVVDICTPTYLHYEQVLAAARAGRHVVCEKPLALTAADGHAMIDACAGAGVKLLVGHVVRFFPEYALAKATVERGEIGRVAVTRLSRVSPVPTWAVDNWLFDLSRSGGMMVDLMIHDFDYARWVAGDVESVFARSVRSHSPDAPGDYALAILRHTSGALSHVEGGWAYPPPVFRTALEIAGDVGLIEHPAGSSAPLGVYLMQNARMQGGGVPSSPMLEDPYVTEIKHFYGVLSGEITVPRVTGEDALAALKIALAARLSAETGRRVRIEEVA
jgi:predicted dehydrogenase